MLLGFSGYPGSLNYVLLVEQEGCFGRWGSEHPGRSRGGSGGASPPFTFLPGDCQVKSGGGGCQVWVFGEGGPCRQRGQRPCPGHVERQVRVCLPWTPTPPCAAPRGNPAHHQTASGTWGRGDVAAAGAGVGALLVRQCMFLRASGILCSLHAQSLKQ